MHPWIPRPFTAHATLIDLITYTYTYASLEILQTGIMRLI